MDASGFRYDSHTAAKVKVEGNDVTIEFRRPLTVKVGERIEVIL